MALKFHKFHVSPQVSESMHYKDKWSYCEYGFTIIGKQEPYFSITGHDEVNGSFGCIHDWISDRFPDLRPYIKWHLVAWPGLPMHYSANGLYWIEKVWGISEWESKPYDPDPFKAFKNTVLLGEVDDDVFTWNDIATEWSWLTEVTIESELTKREIRQQIKPVIKDWCYSRLNTLSLKFRQDMFRLGVVTDVDVRDNA